MSLQEHPEARRETWQTKLGEFSQKGIIHGWHSGASGEGFRFGRWELVVPKYGKGFRGLQYHYGLRNNSDNEEAVWLWQPDLEPFMGRREGPRDCTKSWYFYKPNVEPSTLLDFLRDLEEYENRFVRNGLEVVSRGRRLWDKLGERGVNYQNNSVDIPYNKEKELAKRILNRNEDFLRDMNIRIHAQNSGIPGAPNSQSRVDLIGTENSGGKVVLIELKLKHLRRAVIELLEYLRAWHTINPTDELEGIYLFPMNARVESINEEAVRAEVLKRLYGFDLSLVAFNYQGGRFSYQRVVLE